MIRFFEQRDLVKLHQLIQQTIDICYPKSYPDRAVRFFKNYHSEDSILQRSQRGDLLVLENEGRLVATGSLVGSEITGVFVSPKQQGRQLGRQIMRQLEERAQQQRVSEVTLSVSLPSRNFYEKLNYQIVENLQIDVGEGQLLHYFSAIKKI